MVLVFQVIIFAVITVIPTGALAVECNEQLFKAALFGKTSNVERALSGGAKVNCQQPDGTTPLMIASSRGHVATVNILLANGAAVDTQNSYSVTALMMASQNGYREIVEALLANGAAVDVQRNTGATALFLASQEGHLEIVNALLAKGAKTSVQANTRETAVTIASKNGYGEIVDALLAKGAILPNTFTTETSITEKIKPELTLTQDAQASPDTLASEGTLYVDEKNQYFVFLPPAGWSIQEHADPRTKVSYYHPDDRSVYLRIIAEENRGEHFGDIENDTREKCTGMRAGGITCKMTKEESAGRTQLILEIKVPNAGPLILLLFVENDLFFNISLNADSESKLRLNKEAMLNSIKTIQSFRERTPDPKKAEEQLSANIARIAEILASQGNSTLACSMLEDAIKMHGQTERIRTVMQSIGC